MLRAALDTAHTIADRPAPALAATGGSIAVSWTAKVAALSAHAGDIAAIVAPFAMLAGYATTFMICAWWTYKWARRLWRWVRGTGESGEDFDD